MSHYNRKSLGEDSFRLGARLMVFAAIIVSGFAGAVIASAAIMNGVVDTTSSVITIYEEAQPYYNTHNLHKKEGPYNYGNNAPYANGTSNLATLTITLTSTSVTTETVTSPSLGNSTTKTALTASASGSTSMPTPTVMVTPFGTLHAHTVTDSGNSTTVSFTVDGQTNSVTSGNSMFNKTATSLSSKCTEEPMPAEQSSSTQLTTLTITIPDITVISTVLYSTTDSEEYTGTETVTVTPHVTVVKTTTLHLSSATETLATSSTVTETDSSLAIVTVTVYVSQVSTDAQTGAAGISIVTTTITIPEPTTATVLQTVSPVPIGASTKNSTESASATSSSDTVVPAPPSVTTVATTLPTFTITLTDSGFVSTTSVLSESTTTQTSSAMTTTTYTVEAASTSIDTTCTTSSVTDSAFTTMTTPHVAHTPYPMSYTPSWSSVGLVNSTRTVTVSSVYIIPGPHSTGVPLSSGGEPSKKPPSTMSMSWGGNNGSGSHFCVMMLVAILSLVLLVL